MSSLLKERIAKLRGSVGKKIRQKKSGMKVEYRLQCSTFTDSIAAIEKDLGEKFPTSVSIQTSANQFFSHDADSIYVADEKIGATISESEPKVITEKKPLKKGSRYSRLISRTITVVTAQIKCSDFIALAGSFGKLTGVSSGFRALVNGEIDGIKI